MATTQELQELAQYVRFTVPDSKTISGLRANEQAGMVQFTWRTQHYAVKPSLEVFELKGSNVLITGASMLMQAALRTKQKNSHVIEAVVETLRTAEHTLTDNQKQGLALLSEVKKTLSRLAGR